MYEEIIPFFIDTKQIFLKIHLYTVILGMFFAILSDLIFNFYTKDRFLSTKELKSLDIFSKIIWFSLIGIILSGIAIFLTDIERYLASSKFVSKMIIVVVLLLNGIFLSKIVTPILSSDGFLILKSKRNQRRIAFISGAVSIISWTTVFILGLMSTIPFTVFQFILMYVLVLLCGSFVSLVLEKRLFSTYKR